METFALSAWIIQHSLHLPPTHRGLRSSSKWVTAIEMQRFQFLLWFLWSELAIQVWEGAYACVEVEGYHVLQVEPHLMQKMWWQLGFLNRSRSNRRISVRGDLRCLWLPSKLQDNPLLRGNLYYLRAMGNFGNEHLSVMWVLGSLEKDTERHPVEL